MDVVTLSAAKADAARRYSPRQLILPPTYSTAAGHVYGKPSTVGLLHEGDSKAAQSFDALTGTTPTSAWKSCGYWTHASIRLRQRISVHNAAIAGSTIADVIGRLPAGLALRPKFVLLDAGTNDHRLGESYDTIVGRLTTAWSMILDAGAKVIACTIMPALDASTAERQVANRVNAWIRRVTRANAENMILCDWNHLLTASNGGPISALFDAAGVHPNNVGAFTIGTYLADLLSPFIPATQPLWTTGTDDPNNLVTNPQLAGSVSGLATSWGIFQESARSKVARTDGIVGEWQQFSVAAGIAGRLNAPLITGGSLPPAGTVLQAMIEFETDAAGWVDGLFDLRMFCERVGTTTPWTGQVEALFTDTAYGPHSGGRHASGVLITPPMQVQASTSAVGLYVHKSNAGTLRVGRPEVRIVQPAP